jgi:hypothetical protein
MSFTRRSKDAAALGAAVTTWLHCYMAPNYDLDEADVSLTQVLLDQGVISEADIDDGLYFEPQSVEHGLVHVFLADGTVIECHTDGSVVVHTHGG